MANTREIKNRIESVQQTRKITNAMYLIASTKLRKARNDLANTRPYFDALRGEIKRVFRTAGDVDSPYFYPPDNNTPLEGTYGCLVITADKGLAGAYNQNVIKEAEKLLAQHPDTKLYVVGEYGRRYFDQHKIPIEHSFLYTAQNPTLDRAREISALLLDGFLAGTLKEIFVVYTDMESSLLSYRDLDGLAGGGHLHAPGQTLAARQHDAADDPLAHVLGYLHHAGLAVQLHGQRFLDLRQMSGFKLHIYHRAGYLRDRSDFHTVIPRFQRFPAVPPRLRKFL